MTFPRIIAHRGLSSVCPENTLPAFAAAVALGVEELELDIWGSADGALVVCHDDRVDRTTDGTGLISAMTWDALRALDAGCWFDPRWAGVGLCTLDEVFAQCGGRVMLNLHVKTPGDDGWIIARIRDLARAHGITASIYLAGEEDVLEAALRLAPEILRCCLAGQYDRTLVEQAVAFRCHRLQFFTPHYDDAMIARAKAGGIICNLFWEDTPAGVQRALDRGIDAILTNCANLILPVVRG